MQYEDNETTEELLQRTIRMHRVFLQQISRCYTNPDLRITIRDALRGQWDKAIRQENYRLILAEHEENDK